MQKWEYMDLCPDSKAGFTAMLSEVGEEGWEAVCSWVEIEPGSARRINHILYKRPMIETAEAIEFISCVERD